MISVSAVRHAIASWTALGGLASVWAAPPPAEEPRRPLTFVALADIPYSAEQLEMLRRDVASLPGPDRVEFAVHLGDIKSGDSPCAEPAYAAVAGVLAASPVRFFVLPGDNEWNDCATPDEAWRFWETHFLRFDERWPGGRPVVRQARQPANFAFECRGIVFVGLNLVGGRMHRAKEWKSRHADDLAWVVEHLARHPDARAAVVFAHANRKPIKHDDFFLPFFAAVERFGRPVLYLHGDGHEWTVERGWNAPNLLRAQLDSGDKAPPLLVTVTADAVPAFELPRPVRKGRRLEDAEARGLAAARGPLRLDGVTTLSVEAAAAIAAHRGPLALDDLVWLTSEVAAALARHEGSLSFADLRTLPPESAQALESHVGPLLLEGLRELPVETARALGRKPGYLPLDGLASLPPEVAAGLSGHRGDLSLTGLRRISAPAARALAGNDGYLYLDGLESLDAEVAMVLAAHPGGLSLDGLREISAEVAAALARHEGPLFMRGLVALPEPGGDALRDKPELELRRGLGRR